ncbi:tandem-type lipoprotein [Enterococcus sp. LJL51]|uniref:tandem-type lipoprotein n=1 Tax=Enterococcus sp. LJL51 TaxID=3416656 RepID=UPI003CF064A3
MKNCRLILSIIGGLFIMTSLGGCEVKNKEEVEQGFENVLAMYPTKNLMDFYDMEGYRDEEFEEEDKGTWVLISTMGVSHTETSPLISEGMVLRLNRNTQTAEGFYFEREIETPEVIEQTYPVTYDEQGFHLTEEVTDSALKEKILNFKFFVQYGKFDKLNEYKNLRKMYNPEVPMYELEYQLTNQDTNVKQLRERYNIPTEQAPTLVLSGRGTLEGSSISSKELTFQFEKNPPIFFRDSIDYQPSNEEDNQ